MSLNNSSNFIKKRCEECSVNFCHCCAQVIYTSVLSKCKFTKTHQDRYADVFGFRPRYLDERFAGRFHTIDLRSVYFGFLQKIASLKPPGKSICEHCQKRLRIWWNAKKSDPMFKPPMTATIWHPPKSLRHEDCYCCSYQFHIFNWTNNIPPTNCSIKLPTQVEPVHQNVQGGDDNEDLNAPDSSPEPSPVKSRDPSFQVRTPKKKRKAKKMVFTPQSANMFVKRHCKSKNDSLSAISELKKRGLTTEDVRVEAQKTRCDATKRFFTDTTIEYTIKKPIKKPKLSKAAAATQPSSSTTKPAKQPKYKEITEQRTVSYCHDIDGLFRYYGKEHIADQYRLFIDSSKESLIAALLKNEEDPTAKKEPPLILLYSANCKENRSTLEACLNLLNHKRHQWLIIGW